MSIRFVRDDATAWWRWLSLISLAVWCLWWGLSIGRNELAGVRRGWFWGCFTPETFGGDFIWHVDSPTRFWLAGQNPYEPKGDGDILLYPPLVLRLFAWVGELPSHRGRDLWMLSIVLMASVSASGAWQCRERLGLKPLPYAMILAATLWSGPFLFLLERGQFDLIAAPLVLIGLALLQRESRFCQWTAGAVMAVAPLLKVYPGILGLGLLGLRRWRACAAFAIAGLLVCVVFLDETRQFLENVSFHSSKARAYLLADQGTLVHPWNHSIPDNWPRVWRNTPLRFLSAIPGPVAAVFILGSLLTWVSRRVAQCRDRARLAYPYLLWVLSVGAFVPPMANSYNVVFLLLVALAIASRRDPLPCRLMLALSFLCWQPFALPIAGRWLFLMKIATLASVGWSLTERARELNAISSNERVDKTAHVEPVQLAA